MTVLGRKLVRDAAGSWVLIVAVAIMIAVGGASYIAMMSSYRNLERTKNHFYTQCRLADFWIDLKKIPSGDARRLARLPGIAEIRNRIQFQVMLDFPDSVKPVGALLLSLPDFRSPIVNSIIVRKGTYFTKEQDNQVILSEKFAEARNIHVGDRVRTIVNNQRRELIVVGTAISAEFVYLTSPGSMLDQPGSYGLMWVKRSFSEKILGFEGSANSIVGLFSGLSLTGRQQLLETIKREVDGFGVFDATLRNKQFSPLILDAEMTELRSMALTMPLFFLVVAALVLNIMISRMVEQHRSVIGTLKALGYSSFRVGMHFVKFSVVPGALGGVLGCILGWVLGSVMVEMYLLYFSFPRLENIIYPGLYLAGLCVSIGSCVAGAMKAVWRVVRLEPAEAMRPAPPPVQRSVLVEKFTGLWQLLDVQWQMIVRGVLRNKGRTAISVFAAATGSAIVLLTFGFVDSLDGLIETQFSKAMRSDIHLFFGDEMPYETLDDVRRFPGVLQAEPVLNVGCSLKNGSRKESANVAGIRPSSDLTTLFDKEMREVFLPSAGLVMSARLMEKLDIRPGQTLELTPVKGIRRTVRVPVVQQYQSVIGMGLYADIHWLNSLLKNQGAINEVRVKLSPDEVLRHHFLVRIKSLPRIETIMDIEGQKAAMVEQQDRLMGYTAILMVGFAATIFFGTILNTSLVRLSELGREIATFRTLGYHDFEVANQFLKENLMINLAGTVIGLGLGYWMLIYTMDNFTTDAYSMVVYLYPESLLYTVLLTVLFVVAAQLVVNRKIKRLNWLQALGINE